MARKDEGRNAFDNPLADATAGVYGLSDDNITRTNPNRVKYQPIDALRPDPTQPRRIIPAAVGGNAENRLTILRHWHDMAEAALQQPINARAIVRGEDAPDADAAPALAKTYLDLLKFAASCKSPDGKRHGLVNPITYATAPDGSFVIETGERRWTAYILLGYYTGAAVYESIPARHMGEVDPARQAAENMAREDLTAIGKARQLAKLLMWAHEEANSVTFTPLADCPTDQAYYAQAADLRAPRGWGERISSAMGGLSAGSLAQYRKLWTEISPEEWDRADAENTALNQMTRQRTNEDNFAMTNLPPPAEADRIIYDTPPGGHPAPEAPTAPTPPTATTNGWRVGDRCIVASHGPGTVTHIVTRVGVVVKIDNKPNAVRVHERDLTPLRGDATIWADPDQHHIPAEPTHTPVPGGHSGETVSMIPRDHTPVQDDSTPPAPEDPSRRTAYPLAIDLTEDERVALDTLIWLNSQLPMCIDQRVASGLLAALANQRYELPPDETDQDRATDSRNAIKYIDEYAQMIADANASLPALLKKLRKAIKDASA